jgi:hypothetical protein
MIHVDEGTPFSNALFELRRFSGAKSYTFIIKHMSILVATFTAVLFPSFGG